MAIRASGSFDVSMTPQGAPEPMAGATLGRMALAKRYHGELAATGTGEMLSAITGTKGSAGYVAIERVIGTLHGRSGAFVLQHTGTMTRGAPQLAITVVPDSGSGELTGLAGTMKIDIVDGKHCYGFDYTFGAAG